MKINWVFFVLFIGFILNIYWALQTHNESTYSNNWIENLMTHKTNLLTTILCAKHADKKITKLKKKET